MTQEIKFTPREMDMLACIWAGIFSDKGIAKCLHVDPRGVETHVRNIMRKLGCESRKEILSYLKKSDAIDHLRERYQHLMSSEPSISELHERSSISSENLIRFSVVKPSAKGILVAGSAVSLCIGLFIYHSTSPQVPPIRSELAVPTDTVFLHRPVLLKKIQEILDTQTGIQTVALIGPGGAGKTTLAREYVHTQEASVMWEMNAETPQTLKTSFEELAHKLAKNQEDEKILRSLQEIKDAAQKEKEMISFVRERLQTRPNWMLTYDNVGTFADIQPYFPYDAKLWGHGKVILTTRNHTLGSNKHIQDTISVEELTPQEKFDLFSKIMRSGKLLSLNERKRQEIKAFLKKIPPFPLDVSIAAYYQKSTQTSYAAYLENLEKSSADFLSVQEDLLKETGDYTKNRYGIIALSLDRLLDVHPDFKDLMLLVSLVDSQNIPRDLLERYKSKAIVDNFIMHLKKASFLTNTSSSQDGFSIHRSFQAITLFYLKKLLNLQQRDKRIADIVAVVVKYMESREERENRKEIQEVLFHGESLSKKRDLLTNLEFAEIGTALGCFYWLIKDRNKTLHLLQNSLYILEREAQPYNLTYAHTLSYLGQFYREIGNLKKSCQLIEKSINCFIQNQKKDQKGLARALTYLGMAYQNADAYEKSRDVLEKSVSIYKIYLPHAYVELAFALSQLGRAYCLLGNFKKAHYQILESLKIYETSVAKKHVKYGFSLFSLGDFYRWIGDYKASEETDKKVLDIFQRHYPEKSTPVACAFRNLGMSCNALGKYVEAEKFLERALKIYSKSYGEKSSQAMWCFFQLGQVHLNKKDFIKADEIFHKCLLAFEENYGENNVRTARILRHLAKLYIEKREILKAREYLSKGLSLFIKASPHESYLIYEDLADLALAKAKQKTQWGDKAAAQKLKNQALDHLNKALKILLTYYPKDCPHIVRVRSKIKLLR